MTKIITDVLKDKKLEDLVKVEAEKPATKPNFTTVKVEECIGLLKEIEVNNGYMGVSKECGLTVAQVKEVHAEMKAKIADLQPKVEEVEVTK